MNSHSAAWLVGAVVQFLSAVLLLAVFLLVHRLSSRRQFLRTWIAAWAAQAAAIAGTARSSFLVLIGHPVPPSPFTTFLELLVAPGQYLFLVTVAIGSLLAAGRKVSVRVELWAGTLAVLLGIVAWLSGPPLLAAEVQVSITPLVFFGSVQFMLFAATGARRRGMHFLALALMFHGAFSSLELLSGFLAKDQPVTAGLALWLDRLAGYGDAVGLTLLGAAVVVLVIQDSFLEATQAKQDQVAALASSRQHLEDIIQAAGEALLTVDNQGRIELVNQVAERLFLLPPGTAVGRELRELLPAVAPLIGSAARSGSPVTGGEGQRSDGSRFPVECSVAVLHGASRTGWVIVARDLTAQLAAESAREASERRLAESEQALAVSRVVSSVIRELEAPLANVLTQSEALAEEAGGSALGRGLHRISGEADRARHIVRDLVAFARRGWDPDRLVDLREVARAAVAASEEEATRRGVAIATELPKRSVLVQGDRASLEQVARGLLDNAVEAAGEGGRVGVAVRTQGDIAELTVDDSGAGVREDDLPRLFEPAFTTKPAGKQTALGLSLSARMLKSLGGSLALDNRPSPGIGARLAVRLPLAAPAADRPVTPT